MHSRVKKWAINLVKVAIAVIGLTWVIVHTPWHDQATLRPGAELLGVTAVDAVTVDVLDAAEGAKSVRIRLPAAAVKLRDADGHERTEPLVKQFSDGRRTRDVEVGRDRLVAVEGTGEPKVQVGLRNLMRRANPWLLVASWALLVIPFLVSGWRWRQLLKPQGIQMPFRKALALTFVGQFYSTFLPGITGGDLVKIIYTSRVIGSKTKSTVTVLLDRVIGLIALIVIAGVAAAFQMRGHPTMVRVVLFVGASLGGLAVFCMVYFSHRLRRATGLEWLLNHEAVPEFIRKADDVLHAYRGAWKILAEAFAASLITQVVVPISAWLAGRAFGIHDAHLGHYLAYTPLAILAASLPISFLGLGVMDSVLFNFFYLKNLATASQTFALAQAIRFLPILWNMVGAYWVVTGTYSRHQAMAEEAKEMTMAP